ncbi:tigger transposable element-derived protein 1 [Elysia marginata]|uniref:Tigger transposable element-derived protein 1 n=1 Tax=Elysia marginata TaxID=1093978 RepID=A0AAV4JUZ7_9GAST|nr:tigger transposable element-derived protein 1 [Elysia marginata]
MGQTFKSKRSTPSSASGGYRRNYTNEDLQRALQVVESGAEISAATRANNMPRITLHDYVHDKSSVGKRAGRAPGIPAGMKDQIVQKVVFTAEVGFPIIKLQLLSKVGRLVKKLNLSTQFKDAVPSNKYWRCLKKRYPQVTIQAPEACSLIRLRMLNEVTVERYFGDLGRLLDSLGLKDKPSQIWNCDETGLQFTYYLSQVWLLDSQSSHEVVELLHLALKGNIHLVALPPHTTQELQPLDKVVFGPF